MRDYWSCSKFADKLRGIPKPEYETGKGWTEWRTNAQFLHPIRYWFVEEFLDKFQDMLYYPIDKLYSVKYWILNRFVTKTHALTSNLKRGEYWEYDTRILHCLFDELVNFVEIEKAWMQVYCHKDKRDQYHVPGYALGWFRTRTWRCPEAGIDYLTWESTDPQLIGSPQAESARTILELYHWWKNVYPNRVDPMDASGWSEYCSISSYSWDSERTEEEENIVKEMLRVTTDIEEKYFKEDTEMLIKLINIRTSLWT